MATPTQIGGHEASRYNLFTIDPRALKVDWSKNLSRNGEEPPVDEALIELAQNMTPRDGEVGGSGQLNPIVARKNADGEYEVVLGYRRMRAALWLVESGTCPDFKIAYVTKKMDDAEAALINMSENLQREDPKPIQTAHAIRRLTEEQGMTVEQVSHRLKRSKAWCYNLLRLVQLPEAIQKEVADSVLPVSAAVELAKVEGGEAAQVQAYEQIKSEGGDVTADRVREKAGKKRDKTAKGPLGKFTKMLEAKKDEFEGGATLAEMILQFLDGDETVSIDSLERFWDETFDMITKALQKEAKKKGNAA